MPDLSTAVPTPELEDQFLEIVDVEGKLIAGLEDLGPVSGRDVLLLDAGRGHYASVLGEIGSRVTSVEFPAGTSEADALDLLAGLPERAADVCVILWSALAQPGSRFLAAVERLLRPGGRLLVVHDYGRDDVWKLRPDRQAQLVEWSQRRGPFLGRGFRIRVVHCWWTFSSIVRAQELLRAAFGEAGGELADRMKRPRLEYQVAIYHTTISNGTSGPGNERDVSMAGEGLPDEISIDVSGDSSVDPDLDADVAR